MDDRPRRKDGTLCRGIFDLSPEERHAARSRGGKNLRPEHRAFSACPGLAAEAARRRGEIYREKVRMWREFFEAHNGKTT